MNNRIPPTFKELAQVSARFTRLGLPAEVWRYVSRRARRNPAAVKFIAQEWPKLVAGFEAVEELWDDGIPIEDFVHIYQSFLRLSVVGVNFSDDFMAYMNQLRLEVRGTYEDSDDDRDYGDEDVTDDDHAAERRGQQHRSGAESSNPRVRARREGWQASVNEIGACQMSKAKGQQPSEIIYADVEFLRMRNGTKVIAKVIEPNLIIVAGLAPRERKEAAIAAAKKFTNQ